jgi:hypothetical protein
VGGILQMNKSLSSNEVEFLKNNWKLKPISFLAEKLKLEPIEVTSLLRIYKINNEVHAVDHVFIGENLRTRKLTASEVMEKLSLTKSQFQQIVNKKHQNRITGNATLVDADVAINTFRYLIESKLNLEIDSELPKEPLSKEIQSHNNPVYQWALLKSKEHPNFKYFGAVAYLVCLSYPDKFRPFNFRGSKGTGGKGVNKSDYFSGAKAKQRLLDACAWIVSKELGIKYEELFLEENKEILSDAFIGNFQNPLKTRNLWYYGLNARLIGSVFKNHKQLIGEVLKYLEVNEPPKRLSTSQLREILKKGGTNPNKCLVAQCGHTKGIEIHHLVPVSKSYIYPNFDHDSFVNLMPLCANHHKEFQKYELAPDELLKDKKRMVEHLIKKSIPNNSVTVE